MRTFLLLSLALVFGAAAARAQAPPDSYALGARTVRIPPPAGFAEATSRSEPIRNLFQATEAQALDLLAVHVPDDVMARIERGEYQDLNFYTKVSVSKNLRASDTTPAYFADLVSQLRASHIQLLGGPALAEERRRHNKTLTELLKEESRLDLSKPIPLGDVERTPNSYGALVLMKADFRSGSERKQKTLVGSICTVLVRGRMLWVYTYKAFNTDKDAEDLRAFTKQWLGEIVRANK